MTEKQAEEVEHLLKSIRAFRLLNGRIHSLYKKGELNELATISLEMADELLKIHEEKLSAFPLKSMSDAPTKEKYDVFDCSAT